MLTGPLYNLRIWSCFKNIEVDGSASGPIALVSFKDMDTDLAFAEAVLLPQDLSVRPEFNSNSYVYPIFFPNGEVEVIVHWEQDQTRSRRLMYAIITCTSEKGEIDRVIHYLTDF